MERTIYAIDKPAFADDYATLRQDVSRALSVLLDVFTQSTSHRFSEEQASGLSPSVPSSANSAPLTALPSAPARTDVADDKFVAAKFPEIMWGLRSQEVGRQPLDAAGAQASLNEELTLFRASQTEAVTAFAVTEDSGPVPR